MAAPAVGAVEMEVPTCLGAVLVCLACVGTRPAWVLNQVKAPAEKQFGPSTVYSKSERAAGPLSGDVPVLVLSYVGRGARRLARRRRGRRGSGRASKQHRTRRRQSQTRTPSRKGPSLSRRARLRPRASRVSRRASKWLFGVVYRQLRAGRVFRKDSRGVIPSTVKPG